LCDRQQAGGVLVVSLDLIEPGFDTLADLLSHEQVRMRRSLNGPRMSLPLQRLFRRSSTFARLLPTLLTASLMSSAVLPVF
jgi:hypothetical protein